MSQMINPDKFYYHSQIEHLHMRYLGTGNTDTTRWEWGTHIARDSNASHIGHFSRMVYFQAAENQSSVRMKQRLLDKMLQPCGPPAPTKVKGDF